MLGSSGQILNDAGTVGTSTKMYDKQTLQQVEFSGNEYRDDFKVFF